jgi:hypothetical protein
MRLTIGPLPASVYWRRRAVVLVGLAMIVLVVTYACGGPDPNADAGVTAGSSPTGTASPDTALLRPEVPGTSPAASPSPTASAFTLPVPATTGPCTDAEMEVIATAGAPEVQRGQPLSVTIRIKNVSSRTCNRDIGADMQELRLNDPATKTTIWSSDDCNPNHGNDDRSFEPGQEQTFTLTWQGRRSRGGDGTPVCESDLTPEPQAYELVARLDQKFSAPFAIRITSAA